MTVPYFGHALFEFGNNTTVWQIRQTLQILYKKKNYDNFVEGDWLYMVNRNSAQTILCLFF